MRHIIFRSLNKAVNVLKANYKPVIPLSFLFGLVPNQNEINNKPFFKKIIKMIKNAKKSEALKDYKEADRIYHEALMHLYEYNRDGNADAVEVSQTRSYLFDSMADMALREGNFGKAELLYKDVMIELLTKQNFKQDDNALIEISLKLSMIYAEQGQNKVARLGYMYCIESLENKMKDKDGNEVEVDTNTKTLYGVVLDSFANYLYMRNKFLKALSYFKKALLISEQVLGGPHSQISVIHNSIGVIYSSLKEADKAVNHFEKAIEVGEMCESSDLGVYYFNLAEVKHQMGLIEEASINYKRARMACLEHPDQKTTINQIDAALKKLKDK